MRSLQPLQQHTSLMFLRSLSALSFFACSISIATAASIPPTVAMRTTGSPEPPAPPSTATDPSLTLNTLFIELPVVLHTRPRSSEAPPFQEVYLSIGDRDIACDPDFVISRKALTSVEVGQITFYDNKLKLSPEESTHVIPGISYNEPGRSYIQSHMMNSARETMENMITEVCQVQQSPRHVQKSRWETDLDFADMFINLSLSGKHSVFVQTDALEKYKQESFKYRETMNPKEFQYLDIVLNVYSPSSKSTITRDIDMSIGNHRICLPKHNARLLPTSPLQPTNAPGPGRKRIGFAIFFGDSENMLKRIYAKNTHPPPTAQTYEQSRYLEEFSLKLEAEEDVTLDGIVIENMKLAIGIYKASWTKKVIANDNLRAAKRRKKGQLPDAPGPS
ncbi:hypothetical protein C8R42DRAFT_668104, partial [Lentinula raphanica]